MSKKYPLTRPMTREGGGTNRASLLCAIGLHPFSWSSKAQYKWHDGIYTDEIRWHGRVMTITSCPRCGRRMWHHPDECIADHRGGPE